MWAALAIIIASRGLSSVASQTLPYCFNLAGCAGFGTNSICVGIESGMAYCYGSTTGCLWGSFTCTTNANCPPSLTSGPKYLGNPCGVAGGWPQCVCDRAPTSGPTATPSHVPSSQPSTQPSNGPSSQPTLQPSVGPSSQPTSIPSGQPSCRPSSQPSGKPSTQPSSKPSCQPSSKPSYQPSSQPLVRPSSLPSSPPTGQPSRPSSQPSSSPTSMPSSQPSAAPSIHKHGLNASSPSYAPRNGFSFSARNESGAILLWGEGFGVGVHMAVVRGARQLVGNRASFAALDAAGYVQVWGMESHYRGFETYQSGIALESLVACNDAYVGVTTTGAALAFGGVGSNSFSTESGYASALASEVTTIVPSSASFTAIKSDGTVYTWGSNYCGGGVSSLTRSELQGIVKVVATRTAFAGLTTSGRVYTWGDRDSGGDSSAVASQLIAGVTYLIASPFSFVAFKLHGSLVVWGNPRFGGDASAVAAQLTSGVVYVAHTSAAFAAVKEDGSVVTWGLAKYGGDSSAVQGNLQTVTKVFGNLYAFAALRGDGSVVAWGDAKRGGSVPSALVIKLSSGVTGIYSTQRAFAALKGATGELVVWGDKYFGGDAGAAAPFLVSGVRVVCGNEVAFTAVLQDGRAVAWGHSTSITAPGVLTVPSGASFEGVAACA